MSHFDADNLSFFDTVQIFFTQITGRGVMLGGRDIEYLDRLRRQGISARVICRAIDEAVEQMPDDDPPRDVFSCRPWIDSHIERVRAGSAGSHETEKQRGETHEDSEPTAQTQTRAGSKPAPDQPLLAEALESIEDAGKDARSQAIREVYRDAWRQVRELMTRDVSNPFEELAAIEDALVAAYFEALPDDERTRLEEDLQAENAPHLQRMTEDARRRHLRARKRKALMAGHGLVSLLD